jgi:hypothetical protein
MSSKCDAAVLDWVVLVLTLFSTHIIWWASRLPVLWKEGPRAYFLDVAWNCFRIHMPARVWIFACKDSDREYWEGRYFNGIDERNSFWGRSVNIFFDMVTVVVTALSLYQLCTKNKNDGGDPSQINISLWAYPSLPGSIVGIWVTAFSNTRVSRKWMFAGGFALLVATATAIALLIRSFYPDQQMWVAATVAYCYVAFGPLLAVIFPSGWIRWYILFVVLAGTMTARIGGPVYGALFDTGYFPFCVLKGKPFAIVCLVFGILAVLLCLYRHCNHEVRVPMERKVPREDLGWEQYPYPLEEI